MAAGVPGGGTCSCATGRISANDPRRERPRLRSACGECAQLMGGFRAAMNPGMHQGFSGWNGMTCMP